MTKKLSEKEFKFMEDFVKIVEDSWLNDRITKWFENLNFKKRKIIYKKYK